MYALIKDNKIIQIANAPFDVHPSFIWIECPDNMTADNWKFDGTTFIPIPPDKYHAWNGTTWVKDAAAVDQEKTDKAAIDQRLDETLKAFALVVLDEINILRVAAGLRA